MNQNLKDFQATIKAAQKQMGAKATGEQAELLTTIFANPVMFDKKSGKEVNALELFERRTRRLYRRKTGKAITTWVPIGLIVLFVVAHWDQIMAILKFIVYVFSLRRKS